MTLPPHVEVRSIFLLILALLFLAGADECPLVVNPDPDQSPPGSTERLDLGGSSGANWDISYEEQVSVTLRTDTGATTVRVSPGEPPVQLSGHAFHLDSFCWRTDVVCPSQVLTTRTTIVQPDGNSPRDILVAFNRRGPLSLVEQQGLPGTLDGKELFIPLAMRTVDGQPCTLGSSSGIAGTASASDGSTELGDTLQGRVTLSYSGSCVTLGGTAVLTPEAVLELSTLFVARRR